jgi:hypothetical protein
MRKYHQMWKDFEDMYNQIHMMKNPIPEQEVNEMEKLKKDFEIKLFMKLTEIYNEFHIKKDDRSKGRLTDVDVDDFVNSDHWESQFEHIDDDEQILPEDRKEEFKLIKERWEKILAINQNIKGRYHKEYEKGIFNFFKEIGAAYIVLSKL